MTPYELELVLHFHCSKSEFARADAAGYRGTVDSLIDIGIVAYADDAGVGELTDKGRAYVKLLCSMPIPVQGWSIPSWTPPTYMEGSW